MSKTYGTIFSKTRLHRYTLRRVLDGERGRLVFIGLNPSTADEKRNDPTVTRCVRFGSDWGFSELYMMNIFAYRATDPKRLYRARQPIGPDNDLWLHRIIAHADMVICAWGTHGAYLDRGAAVLDSLGGYGLHCLGVTKSGHPKHPLYLRADTRPVPYPAGVAGLVVRPVQAMDCNWGGGGAGHTDPRRQRGLDNGAT